MENGKTLVDPRLPINYFINNIKILINMSTFFFKFFPYIFFKFIENFKNTNKNYKSNSIKFD